MIFMLDGHVVERLLQELCHFNLHFQVLFYLVILYGCVLERWRQHSGEQFDCERQQEFHERNNNEDGERNQSEQIRSRSDHEAMFTTCKWLAVEDFPQILPTNVYVDEEEPKTVIIVNELSPDSLRNRFFHNGWCDCDYRCHACQLLCWFRWRWFRCGRCWNIKNCRGRGCFLITFPFLNFFQVFHNIFNLRWWLLVQLEAGENVPADSEVVDICWREKSWAVWIVDKQRLCCTKSWLNVGSGKSQLGLRWWTRVILAVSDRRRSIH